MYNTLKGTINTEEVTARHYGITESARVAYAHPPSLEPMHTW